MAKHPLLPFMEAHAKALGTNVKDLTVESLKSLFGHVYYIWRTFKPALGEEDGLKYYGNVWAELAKLGFAGSMEKFGLKEVKDLPTLGKIVQDCFTGVLRFIRQRETPKTNMSDIYSGAQTQLMVPVTAHTADMTIIDRKFISHMYISGN